MNRFIAFILLGLAAAVIKTSVAAEYRTTLTIKADGTSTLRIDKTEARSVAEQTARIWEREHKISFGEKVEDAKSGDKPLSDDELTKKIRESFDWQWQGRGEESLMKLETLDVKSNTVRSITTQKFASLEDMLRHSYTVWDQFGLSVANMKFEKDLDGHLRVSLVPNPNAQRFAGKTRQQWKLFGAQNETRLVFPGKVLSSSLPNTEDNATWITIDGQKPETIDAAMKLYEKPTIIVTELAGLKLDQPLASKALIRSRRAPGGAPELPITDGGPGYAAEPIAVTTTTLHLFPEGEKRLKEAGFYNIGRTGAVVRAKFFAPKDRSLQSVSDVRVLKATDDKGRAIFAPGEADESDDFSSMVYSVNGVAQTGNSTQISLQLKLPQADAQSIDELSAEAIALTAGRWKEMTLTNFTVSGTNEIDLAQIVPGARLAITKVTNTNRQFNLHVRLTGPVQIRQIELQAKYSGRYSNVANAYEQSFSTRDGKSTRTLQLNQYSGGNENEDAPMPGIVLRFPEDQRRERVRFVLKGLDLF